MLPSASLVPENDPTVLFTTAGMHPLIPYIMGEKHPGGKRLASVQKCIRTGDIESVGDESHFTFFEMLGNWSLGDYGRREAIEWSYEFLTKELNIDPKNLAVTCFEGMPGVDADLESKKIWMGLGISESRIKLLGKSDNFWGPPGIEGPCGPDTEMFVWTGGGNAPEEFDPENSGWLEVWNDVFMEFRKVLTEKGKEALASGGEFIEEEHFEYVPLDQKNVDTGMGLERMTAYLEGKSDAYQTDLFRPIIEKIEELSNLKYGDKSDEEYIAEDKRCWVDVRKSFRVLADHIRAAVFISSEGIIPSNVDRGYVLRRIIRRAVRYGWLLNIKVSLISLIEKVIEIYSSEYPEITRGEIIKNITAEEEKFAKTIQSGLARAGKIFESKKPISQEEYAKIMVLPDKGDILGDIYSGDSSEMVNEIFKKHNINATNKEIHAAYLSGKEAFDLYQTYGFPLELITELSQEEHLFVDREGFRSELAKHQELSRTASAGMFKGGLADDKEATAKLHTAAHLMLAALRKVLGDHVVQKGSNITSERLRFDFSHSEKMTPEQISKVENLVNEQISKNIPVDMQEMSLEDAKTCGAMGVFEAKYGDNVKVYTISPSARGARSGSRETIVSREICGGPHASNTGDLGHFKITKEESSSAGVRRIKAILS